MQQTTELSDRVPGDTGRRAGVARRLDMVVKASRAELVSRAVESRIDADRLAPGTKLGTRHELREQLKVAPSTVSEAIKLLEDRGRVTTRSGPGGGVFVAEPQATVRLARSIMLVAGSESEVSEALEVRELLEAAVITQAAQAGHSARTLEPLEASMRALADAQETAEFYRLNLALHAEVAALCRNELLRSIYLGVLEAIQDRHPTLELLPGQDRRKVLTARTKAHRAIVAAIVAGDTRAARAAAKAHSDKGDAPFRVS